MRAPIARLEGFSRIIADSVANGDFDGLVHYVQRINAASERQKMVVDSLLMMTRLGRIDFTPTEVDLSAIARETVEELLEGGARPGLRTLIGDAIIVRGDRYMLTICMRNLLANAFKYTADTPAATIEFGVDVRADRPVYFVKDNGAGFDMEFVGKLFQPFSRLHSDAEFPGNGIGLATVQRIIERHGGEIWAEAAVGEGATFCFTIGP
jgi:signal transduction histidine kinase